MLIWDEQIYLNISQGLVILGRLTNYKTIINTQLVLLFISINKKIFKRTLLIDLYQNL